MAVILKVAYGYQISSNDDPLVHLLDKSFHLMASITTPGKYWVEFAPIRMYFSICSQKVTYHLLDSTIHPRLVPWCRIQATSKRSRPRNKRYRMCALRLGKNTNSKEDSLKAYVLKTVFSRQLVTMSIHLLQSTFIPKMDDPSTRRWSRTSNGAVQRSLLVAARLFGISISSNDSTDSFHKDGISFEKLFLLGGYESVCPEEGTN